MTGFRADVVCDFTVSKNLIDEFTLDAIVLFVAEEVFALYPAYGLPMDSMNSIVFNFDRKSLELKKMKDKLCELDVRKYDYTIDSCIEFTLVLDSNWLRPIAAIEIEMWYGHVQIDIQCH